MIENFTRWEWISPRNKRNPDKIKLRLMGIIGDLK